MNKTTLTLALFGAIAALSGAAFAQAAPASSNVSIYGLMEMSVSNVDNGTTVMSNTKTGGMAKTGTTSVNGLQSRIGFRGNDDLGQGYKAKFELEQRFTPDTGANGVSTVQFSGRAVLGADTPYGEVLIGRNYVPAFYVAKEADPFAFDNSVGGLGSGNTFAGYNGNALGSSATTGATRMDNSLTFTSVGIHGLTLSGAVATSENLAGQSNLNGGDEYGVSAIYNRDALKVGYAYDHRDDSSNLNIVMASYDLGYVKPIASYTRAVSAAGVATTDYSIGATAPYGKGLFKAVYARLNADDTNISASKVGLGYEYSFSARTSVFTDIATAQMDGKSQTNAVDFGMRHRF